MLRAKTYDDDGLMEITINPVGPRAEGAEPESVVVDVYLMGVEIADMGIEWKSEGLPGADAVHKCRDILARHGLKGMSSKVVFDICLDLLRRKEEMEKKVGATEVPE